MGRLVCFVALLCLGFSQVQGDIYLHAPPGSNNRLDEANRDRQNGNRLFDSQNNNRGGYNLQGFRTFVGEERHVEWTNQHGCGQNPNVNCELILQYMCDDLLRDGTSTQTIPNNEEADTDYRFGRHESYEWYRGCTLRERNQGLFTASQNLNGNTARFTRQNPNGQRRGFECPEERDYYPYWHPTPWRDLAILTDQPERNCPMYLSETQNVRNKGYCYDNSTTPITPVHEPNNQADCEAIELGPNQTAVWLETGAWNEPPPTCRLAPWSRDNHLGNGVDGQPNSYRLSVPDTISENCAVRLRYNISTMDYDGWNASRFNANLNDRGGEALMAELDTTSTFGVADPVTNGYVFQNNPNVNINLAGAPDVEFQLAINTAQLGRTFQDRTHRMGIFPRPDIGDRSIKSLSVRGKRGNIVQVFPGVEYDFVPNEMSVRQYRDYIHASWSGSNTNPGNNDGQGRQQSDRSNIVQSINNDLSTNHPEILRNSLLPNATEAAPGFQKALWALLYGNQVGGELSELDDAGPHSLPNVFRFTRAGTYNYFCTRNNNFSNRGQKGRFIVNESSDEDSNVALLVGIVVASVAFVVVMSSIAIATAIYYNKQAKLAKMEQDEAVNPFSPMAEDNL